MVPVAFDEENNVLQPPEGWSAEECEPLSVFQGFMSEGSPVTISCWKMSAEELEEIQRTGRVWLLIWRHVMPPAALRGTTPFGG